jgi:HlyD family secretion protein
VKVDIFRQAALQRLSSPEQLDQAVTVVPRHSWLALGGMCLLAVTACLWAVAGSVTTKAAGQGLIIRSGGVLTVVAGGAGIVTSINVKPGDHVNAGQVVAIISQPALAGRIRSTELTLAQSRGERDRILELRRGGARLQVDSIARRRVNTEREIHDLEAQRKLASEQIEVEEQLLEKGLITKQQVIATQQKATTLEASTASLRAELLQLEAQRYATEAQPIETAAEMGAKVADLDRTLASLRKELELASQVVSPYAGEVIELKSYSGGPIGFGDPVVSMQPDVVLLEALVYVPSDHAKEVHSGMPAEISPSIVKREEFGFIRGTVTYVADYPATNAALMRNFQNESLVQSLTKAGPVTEVRIQLESDSRSVTGFRWSSSRGPAMTITGGTLCDALVVTRQQHPWELFLPSIKAKLGVG